MVHKAQDAGLDMLAITDHDTVRGCTSVVNTLPLELCLVPGVELSCLWSGVTIHVLGLGIICDHPVMLRAMATMGAVRRERGRQIADRLARKGMPHALQGAMMHAGNSQLGRPHFAAWMVKEGYVKDPQQAFDRYLGQGRVGDVKSGWPNLSEAVQWILAAGGVAVIAHPLKYRFTRSKLRRFVAAFMAAGGVALEVHSGRQSREEVMFLCRFAEELGLEVSIGSDFHRAAPCGVPLGVESAPFEHLNGVWERWAP
ncbi:MAG: PHP domain-containing protein [Halioglobus sp.]|nr:PHP domain-containing protein [Halioglobus sp.]